MVGSQDFDLSFGSDSSFPKIQRRHFSHVEVLDSRSSGGMKLEILTYSLLPMEYGYEAVQG